MNQFQQNLAVFMVVCAASYAAADEAEIFDRLDKNADGQLNANEIEKPHARLFDRLLRLGDADEDGRISKDEFIAETTKSPEVAAGGPPAGNAGNRPQFDLRQLFTRLDRNGDGKLSKQEAPERMRENFDRIDRDANGLIDESELGRIAALMRGRTNNNPTPNRETIISRLKAADANDDGKLSRDEAPQRLKAIFDRIDGNSDGLLDQTELRRLMSQRPQ